MPKITYQPADTEVFNRMLAENGTYMVVVHNRHVVKCEKTVALNAITSSKEPVSTEESTPVKKAK